MDARREKTTSVRSCDPVTVRGWNIDSTELRSGSEIFRIFPGMMADRDRPTSPAHGAHISPSKLTRVAQSCVHHPPPPTDCVEFAIGATGARRLRHSRPLNFGSAATRSSWNGKECSIERDHRFFCCSLFVAIVCMRRRSH